MTWISELVDVSGDVDLIRVVLAENGYDIAEEKDVWLLRHPRFSEYESAEDVRKDTEGVIERLLEMAVLENIECAVTVGSIRRIHTDGTINRHIFASLAIGVRLEAHAAIVVSENPHISEDERRRRREESARREAERKRRATISKISAALREPKVVQISRLLSEQNISMTEAGHIVDIVRDACGGDMSQFASKAEISRFHRSINHPEIMGLSSRHAVSNEKPPPKPMTENEARGFAIRIGRGWLKQYEDKT